ncbi:hypothetical protein OSB04_019154 [Centaurea solstitialis]|uniref:Uncharacterized protein n=1 Tax=Centaurea solstitialis TaxID=347529 RepID=A0AA38T1A3_9ASTR|nr:hypothetical protein OSB04_019154 [Centaurea solstitialis]
MGGVAVLHPQDCLKDGLFVKSRRNPKPTTVNHSSSSPNLTRSDGRKRSPPTGLRRNNRTAVDPPSTAAAAAVAKNLVMGQVKILKRGEPLEEMNEASSTTTTPPRDDRKASAAGGRRVSPPAKKKPEKAEKMEKRGFSNPNPNPKIDVLRKDDFALSSTDRLGPDPDMVPKKKNIAGVFFAGSAFVDSPPPSSVPLPGFCTKNFSAAVKDDRSSDLRRILGLSLS